ncbi:hypothetical protein FF38_01830 [Lucilia cuprina]|uniref:Uncharacterized protein n=1 Tax=Lucilia cuprina TaxID=7375 RepID=A0A0L0CIN8_LUCCU|nr:hypothetical protein FF38_01830 [Lucilia cuprina]
MGCCASKDLDKKKSWSPSETNNGVAKLSAKRRKRKEAD